MKNNILAFKWPNSDFETLTEIQKWAIESLVIPLLKDNRIDSEMILINIESILPWRDFTQGQMNTMNTIWSLVGVKSDSAQKIIQDFISTVEGARIIWEWAPDDDYLGTLSAKTSSDTWRVLDTSN